VKRIGYPVIIIVCCLVIIIFGYCCFYGPTTTVFVVRHAEVEMVPPPGAPPGLEPEPAAVRTGRRPRQGAGSCSGVYRNRRHLRHVVTTNSANGGADGSRFRPDTGQSRQSGPGGRFHSFRSPGPANPGGGAFAHRTDDTIGAGYRKSAALRDFRQPVRGSYPALLLRIQEADTSAVRGTISLNAFGSPHIPIRNRGRMRTVPVN